MSLRPARVYREHPGQPYTRQSRKKENDNYIAGAPGPKINIFEMGNKQGDFDKRVSLQVEKECAIRCNALEAARVAANSYLKKQLELENYHLKVKVYTHHVLRYRPQAEVAQADRFYSGMRKPFGRPIGRAALVDEGQEVIIVRTDEKSLDHAQKASKRAGMKLPVSFRVVTE